MVFLDLDDDLRFLQLALQAHCLTLKLRYTSRQRVHLRFASTFARLQTRRLLRPSRGQVRRVQALAPQQRPDRAGRRTALGFPQDA